MLFAAALAFLLVAILTHSAVPLFGMWLPLLVVPLVLGRADPEPRQLPAVEPAAANRNGESSDAAGSDQP